MLEFVVKNNKRISYQREIQKQRIIYERMNYVADEYIQTFHKF